jgi:ketosteroid isomerase-like protein
MQASNEIREVIAGWFRSIVDGDITWRDRHVSHHPNLRIIGTDPAEWLDGEPAYAFLRNEAEVVGGKLKVTVLELEGFSEGDVGWGCAVPEITLPDGGKVTPRWSAVFHREDSSWKLVQLHASIAISNEAAFGDTFAPA